VSTAVYKLPDEPAPGTLARFVAEPLLPLLATMLVGSWFALPWFVFNSFAMGSPSRWRDAAICAAAIAACAACVVMVVWLNTTGVLPLLSIKYILLSLPMFKLAAAYAVSQRQQRSIELFKHFGGKVGNGAYILVGGFLLGKSIGPSLKDLDPSHLAALILS
jgi:hypothetical protein